MSKKTEHEKPKTIWYTDKPPEAGVYVGWFDERTIIAVYWGSAVGWRILKADGKGGASAKPKYWTYQPELPQGNRAVEIQINDGTS